VCVGGGGHVLTQQRQSGVRLSLREADFTGPRQSAGLSVKDTPKPLWKRREEETSRDTRNDKTGELVGRGGPPQTGGMRSEKVVCRLKLAGLCFSFGSFR